MTTEPKDRPTLDLNQEIARIAELAAPFEPYLGPKMMEVIAGDRSARQGYAIEVTDDIDGTVVQEKGLNWWRDTDYGMKAGWTHLSQRDVAIVATEEASKDVVTIETTIAAGTYVAQVIRGKVKDFTQTEGLIQGEDHFLKTAPAEADISATIVYDLRDPNIRKAFLEAVLEEWEPEGDTWKKTLVRSVNGKVFRGEGSYKANESDRTPQLRLVPENTP
jgi:hypothetical protein